MSEFDEPVVVVVVFVVDVSMNGFKSSLLNFFVFLKENFFNFFRRVADDDPVDMIVGGGIGGGIMVRYVVVGGICCW